MAQTGPMLNNKTLGILGGRLVCDRVFEVYLTQAEMKSPVIQFRVKYGAIKILNSPPFQYELGNSIYGIREKVADQQPLHKVTESEFDPARHAFQGNNVVSKPGEPIMSAGAGPCVIFTMYNPKSKIGSISHIDPGNPLEDSEIEALISQLELKSIDDLQVSLFGGWTSYSERIIYYIRKFFNKKGVKMHKEDILGGGSRSVFLDTKTGKHKYIDLKHFKQHYLKRILEANRNKLLNL